MRIEPATVEQLVQTEDGDWVTILAEAGTVAGDLRHMDAGLKVRFSKTGKFWAVFHEHHPGCPHNGPGLPGSTYLVLTAKAVETRSGVWEGLDERVTRRMREINPHGEYDYVGELDARRERREREQKHEFEERMGEPAEHVAFELRKAYGERYRGGIIVPRSIE